MHRITRYLIDDVLRSLKKFLQDNPTALTTTPALGSVQELKVGPCLKGSSDSQQLLNLCINSLKRVSSCNTFCINTQRVLV